MKIYFRGGDKAKNLKELLEKGFNVTFGDILKFAPTYRDKNCTEYEFHAARRSFHDLLIIARTYFPKTTKGELAYTILHVVPNMYAFLCPGTGLNVFMRLIPERYTQVINLVHSPSLDFKDKQGESFKQLIVNADRFKRKHGDKYVQDTNANENPCSQVRIRLNRV